MNKLSITQIADFAGATLQGGDGTVLVDKVSTDSRTLKRGELFVALRGDNFDGHKFVEKAVKAGAAGAVVEAAWKGKVPGKFALLRTEDTLQAYQNLAASYRQSLSLQVSFFWVGLGSHNSLKSCISDSAARIQGPLLRADVRIDQ